MARDGGGFLGDGGGAVFRAEALEILRATFRRFDLGSLSEEERVIIIKMIPDTV